MIGNISEECRLIAELCSPLFEAETGGQSARFSSIDTSHFFQIAGSQGVALWVARRMQAVGLKVNYPGIEVFRQACLARKTKSLILRQAARSILLKAASASIPLILFKGPALNEILFGEALEREFNDLDVLIPPHLEQPFRAVMEPEYAWMGYMRGDPPDGFVLKHKELKFELEVHFTLFERFVGCPEGSDFLFQQKHPGSVLGCPVDYSFTAEEWFVYLATHATKHNFYRLKWWLDLGLFLQRTSLDWSLVAVVAARWKTTGRVGAALAVLQELSWLQNLPPRFKIERYGPLARMMIEETFDSGSLTPVKFFLRTLKFSPGMDDKIGVLRKIPMSLREKK